MTPAAQYSVEELRRREIELRPWFHSIELAPGVVTDGAKSVAVQRAEWAAMQVPDLAGKSFLDVGGADGWYAFEAERRGAARAAVLDHYLWSIDKQAVTTWWHDLRDRGQPVPPFHETEFWKPDEMPGKHNIDFAREVLGSEVQAIAVDFMDCDLDHVGVWDVVTYLGVLYHIEDPLRALRRLHAVTGELAVVETEVVFLPDHSEPLWRFFPGDELNHDPSNWWAPNIGGLLGALGAAGFRDAELLWGAPVEAIPSGPRGYRRAALEARRRLGHSEWELPSLTGPSRRVRGKGPHHHRVIVRALP
jgi:tRNA (mo5U34)-methyltransferase